MYYIKNHHLMIRLLLKSTVIKSLNFNKKEETLQIEFKDEVKTSNCLDIPISIMQDYIESMIQNGLLESGEDHRSYLRIVHSNFKAC